MPRLNQDQRQNIRWWNGSLKKCRYGRWKTIYGTFRKWTTTKQSIIWIQSAKRLKWKQGWRDAEEGKAKESHRACARASKNYTQEVISHSYWQPKKRLESIIIMWVFLALVSDIFYFSFLRSDLLMLIRRDFFCSFKIQEDKARVISIRKKKDA